MSINAIKAQGTVLAVSAAGSPPSFATIPEIRTIGGPDGSANLIDVTDLSSTGKEYLLGLKDEGAFNLGMMYIPGNAVHATLRSGFSLGTTLQFRLTFQDTTTTVWEFTGLVQNFQLSAGVDGVLEAQVTIKVSGSIYETT